MTLNEWLMVTLTAVIVVAVCAQAWFTRKQAYLLKQAAERDQERDKPRLRFAVLNYSFGREVDGAFRNVNFIGFSVANAGFHDTEVTYFAFELGRALPSHGERNPTIEIAFQPVTSYEGSTLSTMKLPHRLRPGESFTVRHTASVVEREAAKIGGSTTPVHMRPYCRDSLGNKHVPDFWVSYKDDATILEGGPSQGRISEEQLKRLSPSERAKYDDAGWTTTTIVDPNAN